MRFVIAAVVAAVPVAANANDDLVRCLQEHITVQATVDGRPPLAAAALTITNGLNHAVSALIYEIVVSEKGRSVPWVKKQSGLSIAGGIEPGETRTVRASLPPFSDSAGDELIAGVTVLDATDADNVSISGVTKSRDVGKGPSPKGCQ